MWKYSCKFKQQIFQYLKIYKIFSEQMQCESLQIQFKKHYTSMVPNLKKPFFNPKNVYFDHRP